MSVLLAIFLVAPPVKAEKPDRQALIRAARQVVAAVVEAGRINQMRDKPLRGDALTEHYVRVAAAAARKLPDDRSAWALAVGLGVALDRSTMLRTNPLTLFTWRQVESDAERSKRLKVLNVPTLHDRHDLTQHFAVSAALTAVLGAKPAESLGLAKEWLDSAPGGSGFSFADLAADLAGIELATRLLARPARLEALAKRFRVRDYCLAPRGLDEGLARKTFESRYGSLSDQRFQKALTELRKKVQALPGFAKE
jgi:hypothetical protein